MPNPISPHLTIYKPQITSVLSIMHRITGCWLFVGFNILAWLIYGHAYYPELTDPILDLSYGFLLSWIYSLVFHMCNGCRYLFWSFGKCFGMAQVAQSGWIVIIVSALATLSIAIAMFL